MKKRIAFALVFLLGIHRASFAATGNADDGLIFSLVIIGFLLVIFSFLVAIDFLKKNGKTIVKRNFQLLRNVFHSVFSRWNNSRFKFLHPIKTRFIENYS